MKEFILFFITPKLTILDIPIILGGITLVSEGRWASAFFGLSVLFFVQGIIKILVS